MRPGWCWALGAAISFLGCTKSGPPTEPEPERFRESEPVAAKQPNFDAEYGPAPPGTGWMQVTIGKIRYDLGTAASPAENELEASVHEPNSSKPSFTVWTRTSRDLELYIGGLSFRLPGSVKDAGFTISNPPRGEQWVSTKAEVHVTEFGAEGAPVTGWFQGTMSARLNRDPEPIHGRFRVTRAKDRHSP